MSIYSFKASGTALAKVPGTAPALKTSALGLVAKTNLYNASVESVPFGNKSLDEMTNEEYTRHIQGKALSNGRYLVFKDAVQRGVSQNSELLDIEGEKHLLGTEGKYPCESIWLFPYRHGKGVGKIKMHQF